MLDYQNLETSSAEFIVDIFLTFNCNLKCPYCCANTNKERYHKFKTSVETFKHYISKVVQTKYETCLCLLGGEPMLYKGLNEIILFAQQFKNFKDIELYTNGTIPFNKLKFKEFSDQFYVVFSIHPKYYFKFRNNIIKNIDFLIKNNIRYRVVLMLETPPEFEISCERVYRDLIKFRNDIKIFPGYIEKTRNDIINLNNPIPELRTQKSIRLGKSIISQRDFFEFDNAFKKPRTCFPNEVEILPNGDLHPLCMDFSWDSGKCENIKTSPNFFKDFVIPEILCSKRCSNFESRKIFKIF